MKKMFVAFGIVITILVAVFVMFNRPVNPDEVNATSYEQVVDELEARYGEDVEYDIHPCVTRDDVVTRYRITIDDGNGNTYRTYANVEY